MMFFDSLNVFDEGGNRIVPTESLLNTIFSVFLMDVSKGFFGNKWNKRTHIPVLIYPLLSRR